MKQQTNINIPKDPNVKAASPKAVGSEINAESKAKELNKAFNNATRATAVANPQRVANTPTPGTSANDTAIRNNQTATALGTAQVTAAQQTSQQTPQQAPQTSTQNSGYTYDPNVDYKALIDEAVAAGNYSQAAVYEQQRNAKIAAEGLGYEQTSNYTSWLPGGEDYAKEQGDLSGVINQLYNSEAERIRNQLNYETQAAADQLQRALQDAQGSYKDAIARQLIETKQAQDAKALRNQINGDRGGIGSAQVDSIYNTGARNREAIASQQRKLSTDTARQLADLRARGKYEEANQLLQTNQQRLAALYDEQVRLQQAEEAQKSNLAALASQYMSAGIMPNQQMLDALGIDAATAQLYVDYARAASKAASRTSGSNARLVDGEEETEDEDRNEEWNSAFLSGIESAESLSNYAQNVLRQFNARPNENIDHFELIASGAYSGNLTPVEAAYLARAAGLISSEEAESWAAELWNELGLKWPYK